METINISLLFEKPVFEQSFILEVIPLAPLSMVSSMPGSYYRSMREPTEFMICGMLENLMGWHFDENDGKIRSRILSDIKKFYKEQYSIELDYKEHSSEVNYYPLIYHLLKFEQWIVPTSFGYDDYWTQHLKGADVRHKNGARNYDWRIENSVTALHGTDPKTQTDFFVKNMGKFPKYYSSPKRREYIVVEGSYKYVTSTSQKLYAYLNNALVTCDSAYLGNSEGWVQIKTHELK